MYDGSFNTFLGATTNVDSTSSAYSYSTAIGYGAGITGTNQIVLGGDDYGAFPIVYAPGGLDGNLIGGDTNTIVYQSASNVTSFLPTTGAAAGAAGVGLRHVAPAIGRWSAWAGGGCAGSAGGHG